MKDTHKTLRVRPEIHDMVRTVADNDNRSLQDTVSRAVRLYGSIYSLLPEDQAFPGVSLAGLTAALATTHSPAKAVPAPTQS